VRKLFSIAVVCLTLLLAGCAGESDRTVQGTVDRVGSQDGNWTQEEKTFIRLDGIDTVYECWVDELPTCAIVEVGDQVVLQVGYAYRSNNYVKSIEIQ